MNVSQIIKSSTIQNFTTIKNEILNNDNLSWKAKGLYTYLMSLPPNWVIYRRDLQERSSDGYDSMNSGFKELVDEGYILALEIRDHNGHYKGWNYIIYDEKITPELTEKDIVTGPFDVIK